MSLTMRVSLPGVNALTNTNPDNFSLYSDEDNILIKEKQRGTIAVNNNAVGTVAHNLGYVPLFMSFFDNSGTEKEWMFGLGVYTGIEMSADTNNIYFSNLSGHAGTFQYYIFYDEQV